MIIFGGSKLADFVYRSEKYKHCKYNFMNIINIGVQVNELYPVSRFFEFCGRDVDTRTFDNCYAEYIMNDSSAFNAMMRILLGEYFHGDAFVLFDDNSPLICNLVDSMTKFMRFRYGSNIAILGDPIDLEYINPDIDKTTPENRANFMQDKEKYTLLNVDPYTLVEETLEAERISCARI